MEPERLVKPVTPGEALRLRELVRLDGQVRLGKPAILWETMKLIEILDCLIYCDLWG